jgi:hypothetical protein
MYSRGFRVTNGHMEAYTQGTISDYFVVGKFLEVHQEIRNKS